MGTEFFWFYDILLAAIFLGVTFNCYKRGFVSSVVGLVTTAIALITAILLSGILSGAIYNGVIKSRVEDYINENISGIEIFKSLEGLSELDTSRLRVNGEDLSQIDVTPDPAGKISIDLSNLDLSNTGIKKSELEAFGINPNDISSLKAGKINITSAELAGNELSELIVAKAVANILQEAEDYNSIAEAAGKFGEILPQITNNFSGGLNNAVSEVIISIISADETNVTAAITDNLIGPIIIIPLRTLIFFILFAIIGLVLSFLAKSLQIVNRIPVIGTVNSLLGIIIGVLKSAVIVFLVCISVNILITITGNTIIFLNTMTIEESFLFKHAYNFDLINFRL